VNDWDVALGTCEVVIIDGVPVESLYHWYDKVPVPAAVAARVIGCPMSVAVVPETEAVGAADTST
jgi:dissimilatory sulfite reductase (desulfoviridin) alpha/beta subunit